MKTFDKQSGICVIVWPRQMLIGRQRHDTAHYFYLFSSRLRRVERITNKLHSLSPHYKLWGKKGGRGVNTEEVAENRTRLFSFTSRRSELENTPIEQTQMSISCGLICFPFKREQSVIACWSSYHIVLFFFLLQDVCSSLKT